MADIQSIQKGKTTRAEVEDKLGRPQMVTLTGDGKRIIGYHYCETQMRPETFIPFAGLFAGGMDMRQQILQIILNQDDIVQDYIFTDSPTEIRTGLTAVRQ